MTLQTPSVQSSDADLNSAPTLPFIAPMTNATEQLFSLVKKYCFERSVMEILMEGVVATMIAAVLYFGHDLLIGMAAMWCLAMFGIAGYRLRALRSENEEGQDAGMTDALQEDVDGSEAYMSELADALV